jgi:parvulin-like peptidyl-prolyl isomerase
MMQTLRNNTKWIMLATAIAFVALMVFQWGMDLTGRSGSQFSGGEIGRVNGEPILYEEFNAVYRNIYDQQQQYSNGPVGNAMERQIEDAAWDQVLMQHLISQELRRRGIVVTDDEVRAAARYEPPPEFRNEPLFQGPDGQFDITRYHQYLASAAVSPELLLQLEAYYRDAIPRSKLFYQQTAGFYVPDDELWQIWRDSHDEVTVRYIAFDPATLVSDASVTITDQELNDYYTVHRDDFVSPAQATVKYVSLDRRPVAADTAAALARVQAVRDELLGGADFAEVAERESADSVSAANGGEFTVRRGQTVPAFEEAAFSQPIGRIGEPVLTQFGYHIIETESRSADSATVRHVLIPISLTPEHEDSLLDQVDSLDIMTESLDIDGIGKDMGLEVREAELIPGLSYLAGIGAADDGAFWALNEARPGEVSEVFETPTTYYVVQLVERKDERTLSEDEARPTVRAAVLAQKKLERAKEIARGVVDRVRSGASLDEAASSAGLEVRDAGPFTRADFVPGLGRMNAAIGTAFGLRPGEVSGVVEASQNVFVIETVARTDADRAAWEQQKQDQRAQVSQALLEQQWSQFLTMLKDEARIEDNREMVLRPPPQDTT